MAAVLPPALYARADDDLTNDVIKEKEAQISQAEEEKKVLQSGLSDIKKIVASLESTKKDLDTYVKTLDANLAKIENKISEIKDLISKKEKEIKETSEALEEAEEVERQQYAAMKKRIKFMYERGDTFYLELILSSKSFGEILNKSDYVMKLSAYDRKMLDEYEKTAQSIAEYKEELEAEQEVLDEAKAAVEAEQKTVSALISNKEQEIKVYEADIGNKEQLVKEYEAEIAAQNAEIAAMEAAVAEERKRLAAANEKVKTYDGGKFKWPAPSFTRISDEYGNRMHPTLGVNKFHNGIDLAAPNGSPILAAYDGDVVAASYSSSMGNYIMLDHGDDLYTIYMHASALYVSKGDTVSRGDKIAAVGSTGRSTGPHLHFSVRLNGSYVSPWNYLSN